MYTASRRGKSVAIEASGIVPVASEADIKKMFGKPRIAMWDHRSGSELLWRVPDPSSPVEEYRDISKLDGFVVREYEYAVVLRGGRLVANLPPGIYKITKRAKIPGTEIIWIDKRQFKANWGARDLMTRDGVRIGMYGSVILRVVDPVNFVINVVSARQSYTEEDIKQWIRDTMAGILRNVLMNHPIEVVASNRDILLSSVKNACKDLFTQWGIEIISVEIAGMRLPEEYEYLLRRKLVPTTPSLFSAHALADVLEEEIKDFKI